MLLGLALSCQLPTETRANESAPTVANPAKGNSTGLAIPRFVSLKPNDTPMREGPGKDHAIKWIFKKDGLPVEITAEFENWRRVRDVDGAEGWVYHSRLAGRRTVMVRTKDKSATAAVYKTAGSDGAMTARLEPGVVALLDTCDATWCRLHGESYEGFVRQEMLWGVYPAEQVSK